jgi:quercetin dioxygenase-like cupin family protein
MKNLEEDAMRSRLGVIALSIAAIYMVSPPTPPKAKAEDIPDGLAVEWEGKKHCEPLYEDEHVRVARCTFPKGVTHVCHSHPSYLVFAVSGGQATVQDAKGTRKVEIVPGTFTNSPPVPWHVFSNVGESTIQFLLVEKKYQTGPAVDTAACPKS